MRQVIVGIYDMGYEQVELVLREGKGATCYFLPEKGSLPRIKVGVQNPWTAIVGNLLHEAMEFCATRARCLYVQTHALLDFTDGYSFFMNHEEFSDICARAGEFMAGSYDDLRKAVDKWKAEEKKKAKRKRKKRTRR